jgi:hypothetical protein
MKRNNNERHEECQALSLDYGSMGYPCHLEKNHKGPHEVLDKDDCPHHWKNTDESQSNSKR